MSYRASGFRAWVWQRVSSVVLAICVLFILGFWYAGGAADYQSWRAIFSQSPITVLVGLFFGALLAHTWVGVRDIILDYVALPGLRYVFLACLALWLLSLGLWVLFILSRVFV